MNSFQVQVLDFTYSNPTLYSFSKRVMSIDTRKMFHDYMNAVEYGLMFVAAVAVVLYRKWNENDCNERVQIAAMTVWEWIVKGVHWMKTIGAPNIHSAISATYRAGRKTREFYELISSPMFIVF